MADAVCRCGAYVRAYVAPGTKINCPQCGVLLVMGGNPEESDGSNSSQGTVKSGASRSRRAKRLLVQRSLTLCLATVVCGLGYGWWTNRIVPKVDKKDHTSQIAPPPEKTSSSVEAPKNKPSYWSAEAVWNRFDDQEFSAQDVQSLAEQVALAGESMSSIDFWANIEIQADEKKTSGFAKVLDKLKTAPLDSYSTNDNSVGSDWLVVGIHRDSKVVGVLIRYFFEPLGSYASPSESADWISYSKRVLDFEEFTKSTKDIFSNQRLAQTSENRPTEDPNAPNLPPLLFAPRFGYLVLHFEPESKGMSLRDVVSLPGEVPISSLGDGENPNIKDVLGIYQFVSDRSLSRLLLLGRDQDPANGASESLKEINSISSLRVRRLAEIVQATLHEPYSIDDRVKRFRREFPDDIGSDALLVSMWMTHYQIKRVTYSFDDFGRVFIEAAHRLFMKTNDPLLLEIRSRIYLAHAKIKDAERCLQDAEDSNFKSLYLLQRRIEEESNANNKEKLVVYLNQLNEFVEKNPASVSNRDLKSKWNQQVVEWRSELEKK